MFQMIRVVALLAIFAFAGLPATAQTRHALVIGIDSYAHIPTLQKARNDARAVGERLEAAGFEVRTVLDPDRRALLGAFASFIERLRPGDEAMFFFAGHGVEVAGRNVLLAADIPKLSPGEEVLLDSEGLPIDRVLSALQARGARASVLIIDACRNNPFPPDSLGRSAGAARGLVPVQPPQGAMVMFSAGTGQEALDRLANDDPDPNSVFTRKLLPLLSTPGLPMHETARRLRDQVEDLALRIDHRQRPAIYDEMRGDFVLVPAAVAAQPIAHTPAPTEDPCASALPVWSAIQGSDSRSALEGFVASYATNCPALAALAQDRVSAMTPATQPLAPQPEPDWTRATQVTIIGHAELVRSATFSPDGGRIVTASTDNTARIWDAGTGRVIATLSGHTGWVSSAAFSPDGGRIVTASSDGTARIWDAWAGRVIATLSGHQGWVYSAAFSPDGRRIVTASTDNPARIWDAGTGREIATLSGHTYGVLSAAFSPDGRRIVTASGDGTARIWDTGTGREIIRLSGHTTRVYSAAFSPDGRRIVTASTDNTARIWDAGTGREITRLRGQGGTVFSAAFSPDGGRIVTASDDRTARIWDAGTGREIATLSGHTYGVFSASFSPDGGRIVTASDDNTARIWTAP